MEKVTKAEFARLANVKPTTIIVLTRKDKKLHPALTEDNKLDLSHIACQSYLASKKPISAESMEGLEEMTLREIVFKFGGVEGYKRYIDALKSISEYQYRDIKVKTERKDLIAKEDVQRLVFSVIEQSFLRLLTDVPSALSKLVIARCESGGKDTQQDVEQIIHSSISRVLKNLKESLSRAAA